MNENNVVEEKSPNEILEQSADKLAEIAKKLSDIFRAGYDAGFIGSKNAALLEAYKQEILDYINEQLDLLISGESADGILNTINEISKALNNDENAFSTLMKEIEDRTKLIPIGRGGTGATSLNGAKSKLGIPLSATIGNSTGSNLGDNCWYKICDIISGAWVSHCIRMDLSSASRYDFPNVAPTNIVLLVAANGTKKADPIVYLNSGDDRILKHLYVVQNPNNTDGPFEIWYKNPAPYSLLGVSITTEDCRLGSETYEHITLASGWNTPRETYPADKTAYCMADYVQNNLKPKLKDIEGAPTSFVPITSGPESDDPDSPSEAGKNITGYEQCYYKTGMRRDSDGRCSVIGPSQPKHIANKEYVDEQDSITLKSANEYTDDKITKLVDGAPGALDTLKEISDALAEDDNAVAALVNTVAANKTAAEAYADEAASTAESNAKDYADTLVVAPKHTHTLYLIHGWIDAGVYSEHIAVHLNFFAYTDSYADLEKDTFISKFSGKVLTCFGNIIIEDDSESKIPLSLKFWKNDGGIDTVDVGYREKNASYSPGTGDTLSCNIISYFHITSPIPITIPMP